MKISQSQENTRPEACNFIKKETLAQVFSCKFYEIFKNTFFYRTLPVAVSETLYFKVACRVRVKTKKNPKKSVYSQRIHPSSYKKLDQKSNFQYHVKTLKILLKLWHIRNLNIDRKILVFKSLIISKIVQLSLITTGSHEVINQPNIIHKIRKKSTTKKTFKTFKQTATKTVGWRTLTYLQKLLASGTHRQKDY